MSKQFYKVLLLLCRFNHFIEIFSQVTCIINQAALITPILGQHNFDCNFLEKLFSPRNPWDKPYGQWVFITTDFYLEIKLPKLEAVF